MGFIGCRMYDMMRVYVSAHFLQQLRARNFFAAHPQFGTVSSMQTRHVTRAVGSGESAGRFAAPV